MASRHLVLAATLGAFALTPSLARADEPAPSDGGFVRPAPLDAVDASDPVCKESMIRCQQIEASTASQPEIIDQMKKVGPVLRNLRRCLNRDGLTSTHAQFRVRWKGDAPVVEVAKGLENHACILQAKEKLAPLRSPLPLSLQCFYQCTGEVLPVPESPPVPVVPPPPVAPPVTPKPPPPEERPLTSMPPPEVAKSSSPSSSSGWYGWQTLIADAASAAVLTGGLVSWTVESTVAGYAGLLLATPIVHGIHGNVGRGLASFGLRLLLPSLAGAIGAGLNVAAKGEETTKKGVVTSAGVGIGIAMASCIVIDLAFLAWDSKDQRTGSTPPPTSGTY